MQRLRLSYSRGEPLKFLAHLDLLRLWERAMRRAELPLAYSEGFSPHPRIAVAAPLPVGTTSDAEVADIYLARWVPPRDALIRLQPQLPDGMKVTDARTVGLEAPSLQSLLVAADYVVLIPTEQTNTSLRSAVEALLATHGLPRTQRRGDETHCYDLRPLIQGVRLMGITTGVARLEMRLRCDAAGSGRPEQVALALGLCQTPISIHRTALIFRPS